MTDVALDWGFLHFGWFSQDYRRLFGETPSQTLLRGREEAGRRPSPVPERVNVAAGRPNPVSSPVVFVLPPPRWRGSNGDRVAPRPGAEEGPWREKRP